MREDSRTVLHQEVAAAVDTDVPEAEDVAVTTYRDGLADVLSVRVDIDDPGTASRDLVDRAMGAAWGVDAGQSNLIELTISHDGEDVYLDAIIEEMGAVSPSWALKLNRQDLAARYGE